jgi:hypothetical protein
MSWGTFYSGSNNIRHDEPPLMSDRRLFTNINPACELNDKIKRKVGIKNNYEYRQYLIHNGKTLIENNTIKSCDENSECVKQSRDKEMHNKYLFKSIGDPHTPYGYNSSDLKKLYISRANLQNKIVTPIITQADLLRMQSMN